tara:strand:+ start:561 stop:2132 length:1572 start_codon:yes stop_codon:yes gene_type:complete
MNRRINFLITYSVFIFFFIVVVVADAQVIRRKEAPETVKEYRSGTPQYEHHIEPHKMDGIAKKTEYDKNLFLPDPIYKEEPYDVAAQIQIYGGKKAVPTVRPWIELGYPLYDEGPIGAGHDIIGRKNLVRPQFLVHGDFRTAVAFNDNGLLEVGQVATRLNLDLDFKITATERIHALIRPFDNGARFTRAEFFGQDKDDNEVLLDAHIETIFFEGDLAYLQAGITDKYPKYDLPIAFGLMPLFLQNGIWVEDAFVGFSAAIPSRNSPKLDISNYDISAFVGFNEVETPAIVKSNGELDEHAADIYGVTWFADMREGHLEASYGYLDDRREADAGFDYHSVVVGWTKRYRGKLSNSIRVLGNFGQQPDNNAIQTADGLVVLLENSLITSKPSFVVPYANFFAGFDRPLPLARGGTGILKNTGINFETDGLTGFPKITDTAQDSWGGAVGIEYLFFPTQQLVLEVATVQPYGGSSDTIAGPEVAFGIRYQKNLSEEWILRTDAMFAHRENNENLSGVRVELRLKF